MEPRNENGMLNVIKKMEHYFGLMILEKNLKHSTERDYPVNLDYDTSVEGNTGARGSAENTKGCNLIPNDVASLAKTESEVDYLVGPEAGRVGQSGRKGAPAQLVDQDTANEIPSDSNENRKLKECTNLQNADNSTYSHISKVLGTINKICRKLNHNPCYLHNISFELKGEDRFDDRQFNVIVDDGRIYGLTEFTGWYSDRKSGLRLFLKWKNLHLQYTLTIDERGKDDVRSIDVYIPSLLMYARKSESSTPLIETTQVDELEFKPSHPEHLSYVVEWAYQKVKNRIRQFVDEDLRNFLHSRVMEALDDDANKTMSPFCQGLENS